MKSICTIIIYIILLSYIKSSEQSAKQQQQISSKFCPETKDDECGSYCYKVVRILLQHAASMQEKAKQYDELFTRVQVLEANVKHKEERIKDKQAQMQMQQDLIGVFKKSEALKEERINELTQRVLELKAQVEHYEKEPDSLEVGQAPIARELQSVGEPQFVNEDVNAINWWDAKANLEKEKHVEKPVEYDSIDKYLTVNCLNKASDVYLLKLPGMEHFSVSCDSTLNGSSWTEVQRRRDGSESFNRNWNEYRNGFGDLRSEFFMGLEKLHRLTTASAHELYIDMVDFQDEIRYAQYSHFLIGNESESYRIKDLGEYEGTAGNALSQHKNVDFSTFDRSENECAERLQSGWWFTSDCNLCYLNGAYAHQNVENSNSIE